jgi:hypothetical protein
MDSIAYVPSSRHRYDLGPPCGLSAADFRKVAPNGFGDPYNAYAHSMIWFRDRLYVGTTRANLCMLKVSKMPTNLAIPPVDCPDNLYELDMCAQIWCHDPVAGTWEMVNRSPLITATDGTVIPRDMGYRGMAIFQGESDPAPALYVATYASARGPGPLILRSPDGREFAPVSEHGLVGLPITTVRTVVAFNGWLFTTPAGRAGGNPNMANLPLIYASRDPGPGRWVTVNAPGFGDPDNVVIFEMAVYGEHLYAGTANLNGFQLWRTRAEGEPPFRWDQTLTQGAYRGAPNQGVVSLIEFKGALYIGGGIQNGGIDRVHGIGPAAPEVIRLHPDGEWDLIVGQPRKTPRGIKRPLSGFRPGFDNFFNGYFWRMGVHDGWLYLGTFDWSLMLSFADRKYWPDWFCRIVDRIGIDNLVERQGGFDLYRTFDGENWVPVSTDGFGNRFNHGVRSLVSTPHGLFVGTANPFGPTVARRVGADWIYEPNPAGGLEVWRGTKTWPQ